ncbi:lysylphosphatidylglycerol synthase domain-containing protein [Agaricicola taiwanensis]|nr:lysylphosphatidylglycerol synthase domain-containing protein [Agaricicola taiwanensis]
MAVGSMSASAGTQKDEAHTARKNKRHVWKVLIGVAAVALAAGLLYRTLSQYSFDEIAASIRSIPLHRLAFAGVFAAMSYVSLTFFDYLGVRYVKRSLPYRNVALASFTSLSMGHSIGFAGLSSGAIRYRYYERWGLKAGDVAKIVLFCGTTVALGLMVLGGLALLIRPDLASGMTKLSEPIMIAIGLLLLSLAAGYVAAAAFIRKPLKIKSWAIEMPPLRLALGQIAIGTINFAFVAACLHQVLLAAAEVDYLETAAAYVIANTLTMLTHVPGGLGVIESTVIYLVPGKNLIGPLLVFRVVYFLAPLALGLVSFAISEATIRRRKRMSR